MRNLLLSALGGLALAASTGCNEVVTETEPLDLTPWAKSFDGGGSSFVTGSSIASGPDGSLFFGGIFDESVDFGGGYLVPEAGLGVYVAHLDPDGNHLFSGSTGSNDALSATAVGPEGDLYATGSYDGAINFGTGKLTGYKNGYLAAFGPGGASNFSMALGGEAEDWVDDVAVTPAGDIVIAARAGDDVDFSGGVTNKPYSKKEAVVAVYDPEGTLLWDLHVAEAVYTPLSVASDADGNIVVTGRSYESVQIGSFTSPEGSFIAKISANGTPLWVLSTTSIQGTYPELYEPAIGPEGDIYVSGALYYGDFTIGGVTADFTEVGTTFWLRITPKGEVTHLHDLATPGSVTIPQMAVAPNGEVLLALTSYSTVDLGGGLLGNGPGQNVVLGRYTPEGEHVRSLEIQGTGNEVVTDLAVDPDGHAVILGVFDTEVDIAGTKLSTNHGNALMVTRMEL